ncbi:hypothetical protein BGX26_003296 [Mortierella sp. AD094]|nr:hypothetical protein BGX26_003296 [Mortierella sp. AD094]
MQNFHLKHTHHALNSTPDLAMYEFTDVKREKDTNAFYYNESDVKRSKVEIDYSGCRLTEQQLRSYFGIDNSKMMELPEILIVPVLDSTWSSYDESTKLNWWNITSHVVAYKPLAWVPKVTLLNSIPRSEIDIEIEMRRTKIETSKLYANFETDFSMSIGGGWKGVKAKMSTSAGAGANNDRTSEVKGETSQSGKLGEFVIEEWALGMCLRVQRVYERYVDLSLDKEEKSNSLTWGGKETWDDIRVKSRDLRHVNHLQFHHIPMSGSGHKDSLYLQVLPGINEHKMLTNLNILFSCKGWADWYAYNGKAREVEEYRDEILAMPESHPPMVTFIPAFETEQ